MAAGPQCGGRPAGELASELEAGAVSKALDRFLLAAQRFILKVPHLCHYVMVRKVSGAFRQGDWVVPLEPAMGTWR